MNNKTALLVIDMQNDFIIEGSVLEQKGITKIIPNLKQFIEKCREKGILIIYTQHLFHPDKNPIEAKLFPEMEKNALRDNTSGVKVHDEIKPQENDIVIKKNRYDAFFNTDLEKILKEKGIENLIITGTMSNICCESTARSAMYHDFNVLFISDLTFTSDPELHNNTLKNIDSHFGKVLTSKEVLE